MGGFSNLKNRAIIAVFYVPVLLLFFFLGGLYFKIFFSMIGLFFAYEITRVFKYKHLFSLLGGFLIFLIFIQNIQIFWFSLLLYVFIIPFIIHFFINNDPKELANIALFIILTIFIGAGIKFSLLFRDSHGVYMTLFVLLSIWIYDNFAYFTGVQYGKNRIFPKLSPKKTFEGIIGGLIYNFFLGGAMGVIIIYINHEISLITINILLIFLKMGLLGTVIGITAQFGDLFESFFKRYLNIKDFSNILGGHGGFLDRFDSILFVYPVIFFIMSMVQ
ncbi:phosphatidate cytidylyltransferase [bacterium]|nr:phosphatidate cytidylyltransferase [bacterium]